MILYADSSAILSIYLHEPLRHEMTIGAVADANGVGCCPITFAEVRSGLARARFRDNPPRLDEAQYSQALDRFRADWSSYFLVELSASVLERAGDLAERHLLRGYDAVHLATALEWQATIQDTVEVATWDNELAAASVAEGLSLEHEVIT